MAQQRKRTDLIERTRFPNPLPLPPYPPKLLAIPTPADRYADPTWSSRLADSVPLPLIVDAEGGMPLDFNAFPELWDANASAGPAHDPHPPPVDPSAMHAEDSWLLNSDLASAPAPPLAPFDKASAAGGLEIDGPAQSNVSVTATPRTEELSAKDVAWLRRTEYIGADRKAKAEAAVKAARPVAGSSKEISPSAEALRIQDTFKALQDQPLGDPTLRHPTKRDIRPVECYDLFPDFDTWATEIHVFKFSDVPGKHDDGSSTSHNGGSGAEGRDSRLPLSLFRPRRDPTTGRGMVSFFLPTSTPASDVTPKELDEILLEDADAFDDEDRSFFADQAGELDESVRESAIVRREEKRRQKGWSGGLPPDPQPLDGEEEVSEEALAELAKARARACTPYAHQRDYDPERQGLEDELARLMIVNFADGRKVDGQDASALVRSLPLLQKEKAYLANENDGPVNADHASRKVAFYHPVKSRFGLRVKRSRRRGEYGSNDDEEYWPAIALTHRDATDKELVERLHRRAAIQDVKLSELPELSESESEDDDDDDENEVEAETEANDVAHSSSQSSSRADQGKPIAAGPSARQTRIEGVGSGSDQDQDVPAQSTDASQEAPRSVAAAESSRDRIAEREGRADKGTGDINNEDEDDEEDEDEDEDEEDDEDDESMDGDEELAALREEAGSDEVMADDMDEGAEDGSRSRRSRRARPASGDDVAVTPSGGGVAGDDDEDDNEG
ncbi:unnamed protein product [Parajaminaea phylloscopi]